MEMRRRAAVQLERQLELQRRQEEIELKQMLQAQIEELKQSDKEVSTFKKQSGFAINKVDEGQSSSAVYEIVCMFRLSDYDSKKSS